MMTEKTDQFKEKPKRRAREFPIDFVVPLQLEECVHRIETHVPVPNLRLNVAPGETSDERELTAIFEKKATLVMRAKGKLRRWEGTSTRFEGRFTVSAMDGGTTILLALFTVFYPVPAFLISALVLPVVINTANHPGLILLAMLGWALLYLVGYRLLIYRSDHLNRRDLTAAIQAYLGADISA